MDGKLEWLAAGMVPKVKDPAEPPDPKMPLPACDVGCAAPDATAPPAGWEVLAAASTKACRRINDLDHQLVLHVSSAVRQANRPLRAWGAMRPALS